MNESKRRISLVVTSIGMALAVLMIAALTQRVEAASDVVIIANKAVASDSISGDALKMIYTGKTVTWESGGKVVLATLKKGETHEVFLKAHVKKTPQQFSAYWKKLVFTGKGKQPKSFKTEDELIAFVAKTDGAIGYLSESTSSGDVKVISVQ